MDAPPSTISRARRLRREMTLPEVLLWRELRRRTTGGLRFRRQHPIGPYVLDFYCDAVKLAVEVDGWGHNMGDAPERDERRDAWLAARGVTTLRLAATEVLRDVESALATIEAAARPPPPPSAVPLPQRGRN